MNRYLGAAEIGFHRLSGTLTMNPVIVARFDAPLPEAPLRAALRAVQARHPALAVKVVTQGRPWFSDRDVPPIPLTVLPRRSDEHWRAAAEDELNLPFDAEVGPLARFVLLQGPSACELICTLEHINADARSGMFLVDDVLRLVDDPELRLPPLVPRPALEDLVPTPWWQPGLHPTLRGLLGDRMPGRSRRSDLSAPPAGPAPPQPAAPAERERIGLVSRTLEPDALEGLTARCRAEQASVQGALMAASWLAVARTRAPGRRGLYGCIAPIDLRSRLRPRMGRDFGIYAWAPTFFELVSPRSDFWALARRAKRSVHRMRGPGGLGFLKATLDSMAIFGEGALSDAMTRLLHGQVRGLAVVSNAGRVSLPTTCAGATLRGAGFLAIVPNVDWVLAATTCAGRMELNFQFVPSQLPKDRVEAGADAVMAQLKAAAGV